MALYPWQIDQYQMLIEAFIRKRGHHALLFKTEQGLGTATLIHHFAQWLLCQHQQQAPCQSCKSCQLWQSGNHPDFHLIQPIENKEIGVDEIREMTTRLQQFSQQGGNVVVYIAGGERLTESASNALLKTLEEPPQHCYFLLETVMANTVLPTIQSRCQTWVIHAPPLAISAHWLQSHFPSFSAEDIETALRICHHRPLFCRDFLENDRLTQRKTFLRTFWLFYKNRDFWSFFTIFEKEIPLILDQLEWLTTFFNDALKAKLGISTSWINSDLQNGIIAFSEQLSFRQLLEGERILQQTQQDLREISGVNAELMIMNCLTSLIIAVFDQV